jgi:uncharacterized membrane protein
MNDMRRSNSIVGPGVALGVGLGGLLDGIVLHQLLGWHHLLSARPGFDMRANEVADGVFHATSWLVVVVSICWLFARQRAHPTGTSARQPGRHEPWPALVGPMVLGWGLFNVVEGVLDHQLLRLHHVRPGPDELAWDLLFLGSGFLLSAIGATLTWYGARGRAARPSTQTPADQSWPA